MSISMQKYRYSFEEDGYVECPCCGRRFDTSKIPDYPFRCPRCRAPLTPIYVSHFSNWSLETRKTLVLLHPCLPRYIEDYDVEYMEDKDKK